MGEIDRKRVAAVESLEVLGYRFDGNTWQPPIENAAWPEADRLHGLLIQRADDMAGCTEGSPEEAELEAIADALEAYESRRWPRGKIAGGKG